jgi:hypothetical protein
MEFKLQMFFSRVYYGVEQSGTSVQGNSRPADQEITHIKWNPKLYYHVQNFQLQDRILSRFNLVNISYFIHKPL